MTSLDINVYSYIVYPPKLEDDNREIHKRAGYMLFNPPGSCYASFMHYHNIYDKNYQMTFEQHFFSNIIICKELQTVIVTDIISSEFMIDSNHTPNHLLLRRRSSIKDMQETYPSIKEHLTTLILDLLENKGITRVEFYNKGRFKVIYKQVQKLINDNITEISGCLPSLVLRKIYLNMRPDWFQWKKETFKWCPGFNLKNRDDIWYLHYCAIPHFKDLDYNTNTIIKDEFCNVYIHVNK